MQRKDFLSKLEIPGFLRRPALPADKVYVSYSWITNDFIGNILIKSSQVFPRDYLKKPIRLQQES